MAILICNPQRPRATLSYGFFELRALDRGGKAKLLQKRCQLVQRFCWQVVQGQPLSNEALLQAREERVLRQLQVVAARQVEVLHAGGGGPLLGRRAAGLNVRRAHWVWLGFHLLHQGLQIQRCQLGGYHWIVVADAAPELPHRVRHRRRFFIARTPPFVSSLRLGIHDDRKSLHCPVWRQIICILFIGAVHVANIHAYKPVVEAVVKGDVPIARIDNSESLPRPP
mmetsp:Transcript_477/g.1292  ORF Transcript_477/g.1292 Transcript_477/m.1292 type:complete len:225 (+) Transcript_477:40-714(+)